MIITPIGDVQKETVTNLTLAYIKRAETLFEFHFPPIEVRFDLKGRTAGMYKVSHATRMIRYNPWLFAKYYEDSLANTVPHEVAHYLVDCLYGRNHVRPHGKQWQKVMHAFEAEPCVTSRYDLTGIPVKHYRTYSYECGCRMHAVTSIRHKRAQKGADYRCRFCRQSIRLSLHCL